MLVKTIVLPWKSSKKAYRFNRFKWTNTVTRFKAIRLNWSTYKLNVVNLSLSYVVSGERLFIDMAFKWAMPERDPGYAFLRLPWIAAADASQYTAPKLYIRDKDKTDEADFIEEDIFNFSLSADIDEHAFSLRATSLKSFNVNDQWRVTFNGNAWDGVIEEVAYSDDGTEIQYTIQGRSESCWLGDKYADEFNIYVDKKDIIAASDFLANLANDYSLALSWNCADYFVTDYGISGKPIDIIRDIATAVGGTVTAAQNGVSVINRYEAAPNSMDYFSLENQFTQAADYIWGENYYSVEVFGKGTQLPGTTDKTVQLEKVGPGITDIRVWLNPWIENISADDLSGAKVATKYNGIIETTHNETIEIRDGVGKPSYPVLRVTDYDYLTYDDLGAIEIKSGELFTEIIGHALLKINYKSSAHYWTLYGPTSGGETLEVITKTDDEFAKSAYIKVYKSPGIGEAAPILDERLKNKTELYARGMSALLASEPRWRVSVSAAPTTLYSIGDWVNISRRDGALIPARVVAWDISSEYGKTDYNLVLEAGENYA